MDAESMEAFLIIGVLLIGLLWRLLGFRSRISRGNADGRTLAEGSIVDIQLLNEPAARRAWLLPLPSVHVTVITFADGRTVRLLGDQRKRCYVGAAMRIRRKPLGGYEFIDLAP